MDTPNLMWGATTSKQVHQPPKEAKTPLPPTLKGFRSIIEPAPKRSLFNTTIIVESLPNQIKFKNLHE